MATRRRSRLALIAALPLAATAIADGAHPLPPASGSMMSRPPLGAVAPLPTMGGPLRHADGLNTDVLKTFGRVPLQFETNLGQTDSEVQFLARGAGYTVFLTRRETVLVLRSPNARLPRRVDPARRPRERQTAREHRTSVVRLSLMDTNPNPDVAGLEPLPGTANYFIGNDPQKWRVGIPTFTKVRFRDVYPGVDVVYYGAQRQLEYDFIIAPGADPRRIRLAVTGAKILSVDVAGDLVLQTARGALRLHRPVIYQDTGLTRREIAGGYVLLGKDRVGFRVAAYDAKRPLVIDPVLSYSTYLGGGDNDSVSGIAVDGAGNAYVTGTTESSDFPTANALQPTLGQSSDAFVTKINAAGSAVVYSTYLGGRASGDSGRGIAVDGDGNAYVTGSTASLDFPTVNAFQPTLRGYGNAFVAKLNAAGSALVYSTYLGGSGFCDELNGYCYGDDGLSIAVDAAGYAYVTGSTQSSDFPTMNALQPTLRGYRDAFVAKLNPAGSAPVYSTYLGGSSAFCDEYGSCYGDYGSGIAVDSAGNAYVTGTTWSSDFPTVNAFQPMLRGFQDAFVVKLDAAGAALVYATYLGGSDFCYEYGICDGDSAAGIAVDTVGNAYVTGTTFSSDFPTASALQPTMGGHSDAFVVKLNAGGSALVYSTYLGGSVGWSGGQEEGWRIAVDSGGNAYLTGTTYSSDFPTVNALQPTLRGYGDAFVAKLNAAGSALVYSTYLGGSGYEEDGFGIAVDSAGNAYVAGTTFSSDFPTVKALQPTMGGGIRDVFVAKISTTNQPPIASFTSACSGLTCVFSGSRSSDSDGTITSYAWSFGDGVSGSGTTLSHTYAAGGTYPIILSVTDNGGATSTQQQDVTVRAHMHVGDLDGVVTGSGSTWGAMATTTIHDDAHSPVGNATVSGVWNDGAIGACTTNANGQCSASRSGLSKKTGSVSFRVVDVTHASLTYASIDNHDPDGDSNGSILMMSQR